MAAQQRLACAAYPRTPSPPSRRACAQTSIRFRRTRPPSLSRLAVSAAPQRALKEKKATTQKRQAGRQDESKQARQATRGTLREAELALGRAHVRHACLLLRHAGCTRTRLGLACGCRMQDSHRRRDCRRSRWSGRGGSARILPRRHCRARSRRARRIHGIVRVLSALADAIIDSHTTPLSGCTVPKLLSLSSGFSTMVVTAMPLFFAGCGPDDLSERKSDGNQPCSVPALTYHQPAVRARRGRGTVRGVKKQKQARKKKLAVDKGRKGVNVFHDRHYVNMAKGND